MIKCFSKLKTTVIFIPFIFLIKKYYDDSGPALYGATSSGFSWRMYGLVLLCILPFVIGASFSTGFQRMYPVYKPWTMPELFQMPKWLSVFLFELIYGTNFFSVEMIFRGALVIGMASILGKDAILPMVGVYAFLHFSKPMGEAIGSIFGGYVLGVIALYTKSILGGWLLHIGIAFSMEIAAYLQYYLPRV